MLKFLRNTFIFSSVGVIFYIYLHYSKFGSSPALAKYYINYILVILFSNLAGIIIRITNNQLNKSLLWSKNLGLRFTVSMLINSLSLVCSAFFMLILSILILNLNYTLLDYIIEFLEGVIRLIVLAFVFGFIYTVIDFSYFSYNHYSTEQIKSVKQIREQVELQYEALKTQLSPHYLFNSLNTVSSLIYKDAELTEEFIRRLAHTYQYILKSNEEKLVSIANEIEFLKSYAYLLKVRFGNSFNLKININESTYVNKIPPLSLQILLENAVKHNVISEDIPLFIEIFSNLNYITVTNNILKKPTTNHSFKIGLKNIKKRYSYFTDKQIRVSKSDKFEISIPVIY